MMNLEMDYHVKITAEWMQSHLPADKLVTAAEAVAALAPLLWGRYDRKDVQAIALVSPPIELKRPILEGGGA